MVHAGSAVTLSRFTSLINTRVTPMHPALILIPAVGLMLGPRLWAWRVLEQYDDEQETLLCAAELARDMLDRHGLHAVKVESTDRGDHFDPAARAVRLSRRHFDRQSLAAVTTAAHEVAHALQHADAYGPFRWRGRMARVAQVAGQAGTLLIIAVPVSYLLTRQPLPPRILGTAALGVLGTGAVAQLAALPTELDASFRRALPMLRDGYIDEGQVAGAHRVLVACSLTYVAASLAGLLNLWPWLGRVPVRPVVALVAGAEPRPAAARRAVREAPSRSRTALAPTATTVRRAALEKTLRRYAKPLIRRWLLTFPDAKH